MGVHPDQGGAADNHLRSQWTGIRLSVSSGDHGSESAPERKRTGTPWKTFLEAHWQVLAAMGFFNVEVLTFAGIMRYHVLFAIRLETREVQIVGITDQPCEIWMKQMARNLTDPFDGFLRDTRYLIDRDPLFTACFRNMLKD